MSSRFHLITVLVASVTLTACQSISPLTAPDVEAVSQARIAAQSGDYSNAARQYELLAQSSGGVEKTRMYLRAAEAYWQLGQIVETRQTLDKIDPDQITPAQAFEISLLKSHIALHELDTQRAIEELAPYRAEQLTIDQQRALHKAYIQIYQTTENWLEKANSHIALDRLLPDTEREANQQQLWQALMTLTPKALDLFNPGQPPAIDSGWFSLAYIIKSYQNRPDVLLVALEDWNLSYPYHPALPSVYKPDVTSGIFLPQDIGDIAVLLPETGPYAKVAAAIKQGVLAAHYADNASTQLHFIETEVDSLSGLSNVQFAYQQAIALGASLVIGPLDKASIQVLSHIDLPVPVLALNRLPEFQQKTNLFQFGLAPEDDAISAAKHAWAEGYRRAVIVVPEAQWGQRLATAFESEWLSLGGVVLRQTYYNEAEHDYSSVIKPLFGLTDSERRQQILKQVIKQPVEFEARRRQDIDLVFLAARPNKARQLVPQFKYHRSGQLPIVATSHAYSGKENIQQDIDLNGLFINDIPWAFPESSQDDVAHQALSQQAPESLGQFLRLFALGADAYQLTRELNRLTHSPTMQYQGATGLLSIDNTGTIRRELNWGTFSEGKIKLLAKPVNNSDFD